MRMGGRVAAAIEILENIAGQHRPASEALAEWGRSHRFAGSGDRHVIGTLVYDVLRKRRSLAHAAGADDARSLVLAGLMRLWNITYAEMSAWGDDPHGFAVPAEAWTHAAATREASEDASIAGDFPDWLSASFARAFGDAAAAEGAALAQRAPIDLRTNILKTDRATLLEALSRFQAKAGPLSPWSVRIAAPDHQTRHINVEAEPVHGLGQFEVQDSASQVAAFLSGAKPGERIADICAGAGGKTLALAAMMDGQGTLYAYDRDRHRLRPIFERLARSGATNVEVIAADDTAALAALGGTLDTVVVDAPCSGSGAWRRKPDSKWRLTRRTLDQRLRDQAEVLAGGASLVRPGGKLVYWTCSVLPEENSDQITSFLQANPDFVQEPWEQHWTGQALRSAGPDGTGLLLTPAQHGTDGFFTAILRRRV